MRGVYIDFILASQCNTIVEEFQTRNFLRVQGVAVFKVFGRVNLYNWKIFGFDLCVQGGESRRKWSSSCFLGGIFLNT